jgi:hypothetical protein
VFAPYIVCFLLNTEQAETFHPQKWFQQDKEAHGYDGPLHIEPAPCGALGDLFLENYQSKVLQSCLSMRRVC